MGEVIDRKIRELSDQDIAKIANAYHTWRSGIGFEAEKGFCQDADIDRIEEQGFTLTPGLYVGVADIVENEEPYDVVMQRLTNELQGLFGESHKYEAEILAGLSNLGFIPQQ